jgi:hypothetical protein
VAGVRKGWLVAGCGVAILIGLFVSMAYRPRVVEVRNRSDVSVTEITVLAFSRKNTLSILRPGASVKWSFMGRFDQGLFVARTATGLEMKLDAMADVVDPQARYLVVELLPQGQLSWKSSR